MRLRFNALKQDLLFSAAVSLSLAIICPSPASAAADDPVPFTIEIDFQPDVSLGAEISLPITKTAGSEEIHGFDFLIGYDSIVLSLENVIPGILFDEPGDYEWEYFTYRSGPPDGCDSTCPSSLVRVVAMADINNGSHHPLTYEVPDGTVLFYLNFTLEIDPIFACEFVPLRFFWTECGDNAMACREPGNPNPFDISLAVSRSILDNGIDIFDPVMEFPGYLGFPNNCFDTSSTNEPIRLIDFVNGGLDVHCPEPFTGRGDLNVNGVSYELADLVLFDNYFLHGPSVFTIDEEAQIAASDVKGDGYPLRIDDLVYMIRVMENTLSVWPHCPVITDGDFIGLLGVVGTDSSIIIRSDFERRAGGLRLCFHAQDLQSNDDYSLIVFPAAEHMDVAGNISGDSLNILIQCRQSFDDPPDIDSATIDTGMVDLIEILYTGSEPGLASASAAGYYA
ncbi:MAG: hypothetical protein JSV44_06750, partial [Candidatus Zixiibacteriota bacterium]